MTTLLANVKDPQALGHTIVSSETVQLVGTGLTSAEPCLGLSRKGIMPVPGTSEASGIVFAIRDEFATLVTEGTVPVKVAASETIAVDDRIVINAAGEAEVSAGVAGTPMLGFAKNASTGSTAEVPHYILLELSRQA